MDAVTESTIPVTKAGDARRVPLQTVKLPGSDADVDYRLAREATVRAWREGRLTREQICDAQRELQRNAEFCGTTTTRPCPVCEQQYLVEVTYVFGPRLPSHGRCVSSAKEMARLAARKTPSQGYFVEICTSCHWNHLIRACQIGGKQHPRGGAGDVGV